MHLEFFFLQKSIYGLNYIMRAVVPGSCTYCCKCTLLNMFWRKIILKSAADLWDIKLQPEILANICGLRKSQSSLLPLYLFIFVTPREPVM